MDGSDDDIEIIEDVTIVQKLSVTTQKNTRSDKITLLDEEEDAHTNKQTKQGSKAKLLEKQQKAEAAADKKRQREETKRVKENEAKRRKIEREAASSNKSKSEQFTYCHIGNEFLKIEGLELNARMLFSERNLENQLIFDESLDVRVEFKRKQIEAVEAANKVDKLEFTCLQHTYAVLVEAEAFRNLVLSDSLDDFVIAQQVTYPIPNSQLILIVYGDPKLPSHKIMGVNISLYEESRTHVEYLSSPKDLALFLAQTLRAIAKKAASSGEHKLMVDIEKGVDVGSREEILKDWWYKMLAAIDRISYSQRRTIARHIPDPVRAVKDFRSKGYDVVTKELSNLVCDNGRRLGPAMAHRIFVMLTDTTGSPIIS